MRGAWFGGVLVFVPAIVGLAACNQTGARATAPSAAAFAATPAALQGSSGCAGEINRFRGVVSSDVQTGNVNRSVYERISADLDQAAVACSAGRDAEATRLVSATKQRHGYR